MKAELEELKDECTWTWTKQNGVKGYKVTGPNGKSIFLPAAGYRGGISLSDAGVCGNYRSSTPEDDYLDYSAYNLYFDNGYEGVSYYYGRDYGLTVRPVSE